MRALRGVPARIAVATDARTAYAPLSSGFQLRVGARDVAVEVRSTTAVHGRRVAGMPYLARGARLAVRGCRSRDGRRIAALAIAG